MKKFFTCKRRLTDLTRTDYQNKVPHFYVPQRKMEYLPVPLFLSRAELPVVWLSILRTSAVLRPIFSARAIDSARPASMVPINMFSTSFILVAKPISPDNDSKHQARNDLISQSDSQCYLLSLMPAFPPTSLKMAIIML